MQPFASVTVHIYSPTHKLLIVGLLSPLDHIYEYGGVPPLAEIFNEPLHALRQVSGGASQYLLLAVVGY